MGLDLKLLPSREVFRQGLEDVYAKNGEDGLVRVLDEIVDVLNAKGFEDAAWVIHYAGPRMCCCHIDTHPEADPDDEDVPNWQAANPGMAAAMLLAIEQFVDFCRNDGLPSIGDVAL
jgi:hypothetical protein